MIHRRLFIREKDIDADDLEKKINHWCDQWRTQLLSTAPADRERVEQGIRYVLRYFHKPHKVPIIWVDSPAMMAVVACAASTIYASKRRFTDIEAMNASINNNGLYYTLFRAIEEELSKYREKDIDPCTRTWVFDRLLMPLRTIFGYGIIRHIARSVREIIVDATVHMGNEGVRRHRLDSIGQPLYGTYSALVTHAIDAAVRRIPFHGEHNRPTETIPLDDATCIAIDAAFQQIAHTHRGSEHYFANLALWWTMHFDGRFAFSENYLLGPAYHAFFSYAFGLPAPKLLQAYCDLLSTGWIFFANEFVVVCERPALLKTTHQRGRDLLHAPDGPAVVWRDGTALWYLNDMCVPRNVVEAPETITAKQILHERNTEVRRILLDRMGVERYLREIGATVRHEDADQYGFPRRLLVADIGDVEPLCVVEVVNTTPEPIGYTPKEGENGLWRGHRWHKKYMLRVPPECQTAQEAVAWTFFGDAETYRPFIET
jgi:hypothetical protein